MALVPHKEVKTVQRPQGTITEITCWMTEGDEVIGTFDNCYVVEQDGKHILIDSLRTFYWDLLVEELDKTGVDLLVLTHGHFDHSQNARAVVDRFGAPVAMNQEDYALIEDQMSRPLTADTDAGRDLLVIANDGFAKEEVASFNVDIDLQPGMTLNEYGLDAQVLDASGHTPGHVCIDLWNSDLFVGDAFLNPGEPVRAMIFVDATGVDATIQRILEIDDERTVHFGHGDDVPLSVMREIDF